MVIKVENRNISLMGGGLPTSNSKNYDRCLFIFGEEWGEFDKTAVFWQKKDQRYEMLLDDADSCSIPWEAQAEDGFMFVGVIGRNGDTVVTSKILVCPVNEGTAAGNENHDETQSIYDQMILNVENYLSRAEDAAEKAEAVSVNTPYIGSNGNWYIWDTAANMYIDSGRSALGTSSGGDMKQQTYDTDGDGIVDNASALGGVKAENFATVTYVQLYVSQQITGALEGSY